MHTIEFIAKNINLPLQKEIYNINSICAFTGDSIDKGCKISDFIGDSFMDYEYLKFNSPFISIAAAKCLSAIFPLENKKRGFAGLRNYSFIATNDNLRILSKDMLMRLILETPEPPFVLAYSFNCKKHISIKSQITYDKNNIIVCTDTLGNVVFNRSKINLIYPIIQNWYSRTADMPPNATYFTKADILNGTDHFLKISKYGTEKFQTENKLIAKFRQTPFLEIFTRFLNIIEDGNDTTKSQNYSEKPIIYRSGQSIGDQIRTTQTKSKIATQEALF